MGHAPDAFWRQTPRLLQSAIRGYTARVKAERKDAMFIAWHTAVFARADKIPKLSDVLAEPKKTKPPRAKTNEELLITLKKFAAMRDGVMARQGG